MAWSTQNNSKDNNDRNVNTRGITLYNKNGFDPSALSIGFWNESFLSLKINPALEKSQQTQTKVFDYEKTVSTALTVQLMQLMSHAIKTYIYPAIEAGEDKSVGLQVGGDSLVVVSTGKRMTGEIRPCIGIHKGLDPQTKKPEMSIFYEFNKSQIIEDFNEENGAYNIISNINSELELFVNILDASIAALSKGNVHAMRSVMKFYNDKLMNTTLAIANKVGAPVPQTTSRYNASGNKVDFATGNTSSYNSHVDDGEIENIGDLSEMMG